MTKKSVMRSENRMKISTGVHRKFEASMTIDVQKLSRTRQCIREKLIRPELGPSEDHSIMRSNVTWITNTLSQGSWTVQRSQKIIMYIFSHKTICPKFDEICAENWIYGNSDFPQVWRRGREELSSWYLAFARCGNGHVICWEEGWDWSLWLCYPV